MTNEQMQLFEIDGGEKELDEEGQEILESLRNLRAEIKALLALEADAKQRMLKFLGGCEFGVADGERVVRAATVLTERPDLEALRANPAYAAALRAHVVSGEYTKLTILR
jgi:hypothetical protein